MGLAPIQIDISYHKAGVGHFVDLWNWKMPLAFGGPGGCALLLNKQLSCIGGYTRISMENHIGYGTAIVWEDPGVGISICAANMNNFGPVFTCAGTAGYMIPDAAYTHAMGLNIHIAAYDPAITTIVEFYVSWFDIIPGGIAAMPCGFPPVCTNCAVPLPITVEDNWAVAIQPNSLHIDAPDHYGVANWAYTYEIANNIYARIMNWNPGGPPMPSFGGAPATVCFTDGSYAWPVYPPGLPVLAGVNDIPVIAYDNHFNSGNPSFYVAWRTSFIDPAYNPTSNAYVAIQIKESGMISNPLMPYSFFGASLVPGNISPTPSIALSKQNDQSPFLYETFSEMAGGAFQIRNRFVPWSAGSFRPGGGEEHHDHEITINPNPFKTDLRMNFPHDIEMEKVMLKVTDVTGRDYGTYNDGIYGVNQFLSGVATKLIPGNYIVNVECPAAKLTKAFKVTKIE